MKTLHITNVLKETIYPPLTPNDIDLCKIDVNSLNCSTKTSDLKLNYEWVIEQNKLFYELSGVDLIQRGWITKWLKNQLIRFLPTDMRFDPILQDEAIWLENASQGGYIKAPPAGKYHIYCYDISGAYMSVLCDPSIRYPIKRGDFEILDKLPINFPTTQIAYGLYRVIIEGNSPKFVKNKHNTYDNCSINVAIAEKLKVSLIQDGKPNALRYYFTKGQTTYSHVLFKTLCDYLWDLKMKAPPTCVLPKIICSALWGTICHRFHYHNKRLISINELIVLEENEIPKEINKDGMLVVCDDGYNYSHPLARIKPFLLGRQRSNFYEIALRPYWNTIIRAYTDSIWVTQPIPKWDTHQKQMGKMCISKPYDIDVTIWYEEHSKKPQFTYTLLEKNCF